MFKVNLYSDIYKKFNTSKSEDKKDLNKFYVKSNEYKKETKLSSLMKLLSKISEFLILLEPFYIPSRESDINSIPAAPLFYEDFKQDEINTEESEKKEEKETKKDKESYKRIIKGEDINSFRFIVLKEENKTYFEIICLDASYGLKEYLKINPYSTLLTSGTLSIKSIKNLLKVKFFQELNNDHVIKKDQLKINIITGYQFNNKKNDYSFTYKNRDSIIQIKSLGNEIYNLVNSVKKGGVLVFFQSYEYLEKCHRIWLKEKIIQKYETIKTPIFDISCYRKNNEKIIIEAKKNNNLLLFTVYRGKNSEGINFADDEARMIICVGFPYPKLSDIKVQLKREFLNQRNKLERNGFDGSEWYREEAMNAVNQSLGRLIRHINDYGIMICFGIEFSYNICRLSKWIKNNKIENMRRKENDQTYYNGLNMFLNELREKITPKKYLNNI